LVELSDAEQTPMQKRITEAVQIKTQFTSSNRKDKKKGTHTTTYKCSSAIE